MNVGYRKWLYLPFFLCLAWVSAAQGRLQASVDALAADPVLQSGKLSITVVDVEDNRLLASHAHKEALIPASSLKVLTTATALLVLGKGYRFKTELQYDGYIDGAGVLHGNIYIQGFGDPSLASDQLESALNLDEVLAQFVAAVQAAGIRQLTGGVVGDGTFFSDTPVPDSWDDTDIGNYYGAGIWGLNIHENLFYLHFKQHPTTGGRPKVLRTEPAIPGMNFQNNVRSGRKGSGDNAYIYGGTYCYDRPIDGSIPPGNGTFSIKGSIPDAPFLAANLLHERLITAGLKVNKVPRGEKQAALTERNVISTVRSPALEAIVNRANLESVNMYCESLLKVVGKIHFGEGSRTAGSKAVEQVWGDRGVDLNGMQLIDGSGMSRLNRISSYQLAQITRKAYIDPNISKAFYDSLPVAGKSGTMAYMLKGTSAAGRLRAKTGSMRGVRSYTGFATNRAGKLLAFSIIVNDYNCSNYTIRKKIEPVLLAICN